LYIMLEDLATENRLQEVQVKWQLTSTWKWCGVKFFVTW
jgi:hypothetical protein